MLSNAYGGMVLIPYSQLEVLVHQAVTKALDETDRSKRTAGQDVYFSVEEAACFLSKTPNALRVMACKNQISYMKKQNKLYFKKSDMIQYLESGRVECLTKNAVDILTKRKH